MSTKVYEGFRIKRGKDAHDLALYLRGVVWPEVTARLRILYVRLLKEAVNPLVRADMYREIDALRIRLRGRGLPQFVTDEQMERPFTPTNASDLVRLRYQAQESRGERNEWDFDMWVRVWKVRGRYLCIPREEQIAILNRGKKEPILAEQLACCSMIEEYAYWDNTDRPEHVSARGWKMRSRAWDSVDEVRCDVRIDLMSTDVFSQVCPAWKSPEMREDWTKVRDQYPVDVLAKHGFVKAAEGGS